MAEFRPGFPIFTCEYEYTTMRRRLTPRIWAASVAVLAFCPFDGSREPVEVKTSEPTGAWRLTCVSPDGKNRECTVTVLRAGEVLQGTIEADGETQPAQDVAFAEGVLSFGVDGKFAGLAYRLKYSGKPQGDTLSGRVRWSYSWASGTFPFRGERIGEQLASTP